jgi:DNA-directed RNA polymerase specialized sigma24 family protein
MAKRKTENYVNNKDFLDALMVYRKMVMEAEQNGLSKPRVPSYIGECFLKIATHLSYKPNFVNYMFREDMICDGIENCLQYIHNFNPEKSTNPFAYFTQIIYFAFLRRISKEKKQLEIKDKILEKSGYDEVLYTDDYGSDMAGYNTRHSDLNSIKENLEMRSKR